MIELDHGIRLKGTSLWLDATRVKDFSFVSHAHQDHVAAHRNIICSTKTARLFRRPMPKAKIMAHPFHTPFDQDHLKLELYPAGHILGSSQILIEKGHTRIVYTGDFKLRKNIGWAAECGLHNQDIARDWLGRLGCEAFLEFEVARIDNSGLVFFNQDLG